MKTAKKAKSNNVVSEKHSGGATSGNKTYFKPALKPVEISQTVPDAKAINGDKQFYVDFLKDKLLRVRTEKDDTVKVPELTKSTDDGNQAMVPSTVPVEGAHNVQCTGCVEKLMEIDEWKKTYNGDVTERKDYKNLYLASTAQFSELYSKYNDLLKATTELRNRPTDATSSSCENIFTPNELKFLQCMSLDKPNDCTFILNALKFGYKGNLSVFALRTLNGTGQQTEITDEGESIRHLAKDPLTPSKVCRIKALFIERIAKCEISSDEYTERMKDPYVNKLFAAGIRNLSKKKKPVNE